MATVDYKGNRKAVTDWICARLADIEGVSVDKSINAKLTREQLEGISQKEFDDATSAKAINAADLQAAQARLQGQIPTIILLTPSFLPHRVALTKQGWFEQTGGLWGPSEPGDSPVTGGRMRERISRETNLVNLRRNLTLPADVAAPRLFRCGTCG